LLAKILEGSKLSMSPKNDRGSQHFKWPYFITCLHQAGSLTKPYCLTNCVGVAKGDLIGYTRGGATANMKLIFMSNTYRAN